MWDETLIESRRHRAGKRRWVTAALSVSLHVFAVAVIIAASFWYLEAVEPQIPRQVFYAPQALPDDSIHVMIRQGNPHADNPASADRPVAPAQPEPQVTQQSIDPNRDLDASEDPMPVPFNPADAGPIGTGPVGDPDGPPDGPDRGIPGDGIRSPMIVEGAVESPVLVHRVEPDYPDYARRARIEGLVVLRAVITRAGDVEIREVLQSVNPILEREAVKAVSQWKYRPARFNNRPVSVWFTVTVSFRLR